MHVRNTGAGDVKGLISEVFDDAGKKGVCDTGHNDSIASAHDVLELFGAIPIETGTFVRLALHSTLNFSSWTVEIYDPLRTS